MKIKKKNLKKLIESFLFEQEKPEFDEQDELSSFSVDITLMNNDNLKLSFDYKHDETNPELSVQFETAIEELNSKSKTYSLKSEGLNDPQQLDEIKAYANIVLIYLPGSRSSSAKEIFNFLSKKIGMDQQITDVSAALEGYEAKESAESRTEWLNSNVFTSEHKKSVDKAQEILKLAGNYLNNINVS